MKRKYQSEILGVIHQDAVAMYAVGAISEAKMKAYDADCLAPVPASKAPSARHAPVLATVSPVRV
jgi:DNA-binding transcriptional regulator YiaG